MNSIRRRNDIIQLVKHQGSVDVDQLVEKYGVSVETIRRDLRILDEKGIVRRTYGGAVKKEQKTWDMPYLERVNLNYKQKEAIAQEAVKLIENGDSVFIDGNTTGLAVSRHIPVSLEATIVTNSTFAALNIVQKKGKAQVFLIGGEVGEDGMTSGHKLYQELRQYRFDKAMFSCMGITSQGCFFSKVDPLHVAQMLADISKDLILMADFSKMNRNALFFGLDLRRIDTLVTDSDVPAATLEKLRQPISHIIVAKTAAD
ncbi:DeoR/GlpR family DNA-binding transcription regulator [Paenibacillus sp. YYML68]|uniref:DeoR/GlpR family DNA-binding transcription regulator n=1 Tax=Paenibacillus sp. YYML68 TaxID=2909250 RepID=UPI002492C6E1|nr:DeoR/GlpR family DNA-binding transcription regulator [Paenibacillus sp. YYML68]